MPDYNTTLLHFKKYQATHDLAMSALLNLREAVVKLQ
jgi:hypothetical protein